MANGGQPPADQPRAQRTNRTDWEALVVELYTNAISDVPFGIGIASKQKGLLGASLELRLNENFPIPPVTAYIRKNFNVAKLDRIFQSAQGLERGATRRISAALCNWLSRRLSRRSPPKISTARMFL